MNDNLERTSDDRPLARGEGDDRPLTEAQRRFAEFLGRLLAQCWREEQQASPESGIGVILRKVWGGSRTWAGARAQSVLMSVWRTCWQQGRSALDFLSQLLRDTEVALALPP